ncbi:32647_t:CDS:2, partial [Gigaspora margarita]
ARLKKEANRLNIYSRGLKQCVKTRWYNIYNCIDSIINHKEALENWFLLEDCFSKNEPYLIELALNLFFIIPHIDGIECVWSRLGWLYGKNEIFDEEENLLISKVLNLNTFCNNLEELEFSMDEEYYDEESH